MSKSTQDASEPSNRLWLLGALLIAVLCLAAQSVLVSPVEQGTTSDKRHRRRDAKSVSPKDAISVSSRVSSRVSSSVGETEAGDSSEENRWNVRVPEEHRLVSRIVSKQYTDRSAVVAGRFLEDFEVQVSRLQSVDITRSRLRTRGPDWVQVEAPFVAEKSEDRWLAPPEGTAWMRFIRNGVEWKLEDLRLLPLRKFR